jgi:hypothetical protein
LRDRADDHAEVSDATQEIYASHKRDYIPITEVPARLHLAVNTSDDLEPALRRFEDALAT